MSGLLFFIIAIAVLIVLFCIYKFIQLSSVFTGNGKNITKNIDVQVKQNKTLLIWNLVIFCMIYFIFELGASNGIFSGPSIASGVVFQYLLPYGIMKYKISRFQLSKNQVIMYSWVVSFIILLVRIILGIIIFSVLSLILGV